MDDVDVNGSFAGLVLATLDADPGWERHCARLKQLFPGPEDHEPRF